MESEGLALTSTPEPNTSVAVRYWLVAEGRDAAKVYTWSFDVS
jgi:hypothetical protein